MLTSAFAWVVLVGLTLAPFPPEHQGHSGDFGNAAKMVGKMSKSVMQLISIRF